MQIAKENTEIVMLTGMRIPKEINVNIANKQMITVTRVKYLGVIIDNARKYIDHLETVSGKADAVVGMLRRLLPNANSPSVTIRRLHYNVWESVILYASPVWADALAINKILKRAQRSALISTSTAYRTVSHSVLCVLTGNIPTCIKAKLREKIFKIKGSYKNRAEGFDCSGCFAMKKEIERVNEKATEEWQKEWHSYSKDNWTPKMISDATIFTKKRKDIYYYMMMILSSHGIFNANKKRINKERNNKCWECNQDPDDAENRRAGKQNG
jgi:hypothetical protein